MSNCRETLEEVEYNDENQENGASREANDGSPMSSRKKSATTSSRKTLVKISNKKSNVKKRNLFPELSFVEQHVDTFYVGVGDNWQTVAYNPVQARTSRKADPVVKDWVNYLDVIIPSKLSVKKLNLKVHPDSQLVKARKRLPMMTSNSNTTSRTRDIDRRYRPLEFVCNSAASTKTPTTKQYEQDVHHDMIENADHEERSVGLLRKLVEDLNQTDMSQKQSNTPVGSRVFVVDTPVEYYGVSIFERRRLGI